MFYLFLDPKYVKKKKLKKFSIWYRNFYFNNTSIICTTKLIDKTSICFNNDFLYFLLLKKQIILLLKDILKLC